MNLIEGIFFTSFLLYFMYYIFVSEIKGLNFALKMNFIGALMAPVIALFMNKYLVSSGAVSEIYIYLVGFFTMIILFIINYLSTLKAGLDKKDCEEYKLTDSLINSSKAMIIYLLTFIAVLLSPILQYPFIEITKNFNQSSEYIMYSIVGFYLALVSLSTTIISYESNKKQSCDKSDKDIILSYENSKTRSETKIGCMP